MRGHLILALWFFFFLSPCFTTNILDYFIGTDFLAFSTALMISAYMYVCQKRYSSPSNDFTYMWVLVFLLSAFFILIFGDVRNPWGVYKYAVYITAVYLIFRMSQASAAQLINNRLWVTMLAVVGNIYAFIAIAQVFHLFPEDPNSLFAIWTYIPRFSGPLLQPNLTALLLVIIVATLFIQSIRDDFKKTWLLASLLPCAVILASNSRSGILLLLLVLLILFICTQQKKAYSLHISATMLVAFMIALCWNTLLQQSGNDVAALGSRLAEGGMADRLNLWYSSIYLFSEHPLLGIGYGNLASYFAEAQAYVHEQHPDLPAMAAATYWSHNIVLQFFAEGGIIAGGAMLMLLFFIAKRIFYIVSQGDVIASPYFPAALMVLLIILHGMVSISIYQGFFLCLLGLYLAALFPLLEKESQVEDETKIEGSVKGMNLLFFVPAVYLMITFYQFVHIQTDIRAVFDDDPDTPRFIAEVSRAIDNPWLTRSGLEYLFANMEMTNAPVYQWINAYPLLYWHWQLAQDPLSLKRMILHAHLTNNHLSEMYWADIYIRAFPHNGWNQTLISHIKVGHKNHEPLSIR